MSRRARKVKVFSARNVCASPQGKQPPYASECISANPKPIDSLPAESRREQSAIAFRFVGIYIEGIWDQIQLPGARHHRRPGLIAISRCSGNFPIQSILGPQIHLEILHLGQPQESGKPHSKRQEDNLPSRSNSASHCLRKSLGVEQDFYRLEDLLLTDMDQVALPASSADRSRDTRPSPTESLDVSEILRSSSNGKFSAIAR